MTAIDDVAYRTIDGITLLARLYWPDRNGPVKWIIDVHGGAWDSGNRLNNSVIHEDLAAHGADRTLRHGGEDGTAQLLARRGHHL